MSLPWFFPRDLQVPFDLGKIITIVGLEERVKHGIFIS